MKINPELDLADMVTILRDAMGAKFPGCEIGEITITSFDKPKIIIYEDDLVETFEFKHRAKIK